MNCDIHRGKALDYYCADCKKVVCVSCFVESHKAHDCKDVNTVEEEFRQSIKSSANIISTLAEELQDKKSKMESKEEFLKKIATRESEILLRSKELKDMIDEHTKSLLSSLDELKNRYLKEIQVEEEELDRRFTILESFSRYCEELRTKGSASDVCRSKDELLRRADELEEKHETYIMRPRDLFDVTFQATEFENLLITANENIIGRVNVNSVPTTAVYNNTMFLSGVGNAGNEIWKCNFDFDWKRCGSLVEGRKGHCAEFIGETLYICGGRIHGVVMDSIEAYNALAETSTTVGQLMVGVYHAASVAYNGSIYVFGGLDEDDYLLDCVQVFNSLHKTCTLLSTTLPCAQRFSRALLWETNVILLCAETCFILNMNENTWKERQQFKTDTVLFGMAFQHGRIFVVGGLNIEDDENGNDKWIDEVKYIRVSSIVNNEAANWKTFPHLPKEAIGAIAVAKLSLLMESTKPERCFKSKTKI